MTPFAAPVPSKVGGVITAVMAFSCVCNSRREWRRNEVANQSNTLGIIKSPRSGGARAGASSGSAALGSRGDSSNGADGASSPAHTSEPSPAGTQRGPEKRPLPLAGFVHEITPPRDWMQVKLRPEGVEQVFVLPRLRIQVRDSPPSQPAQVWVPSELLVQYTSKLDAFAPNGRDSSVSSNHNLDRWLLTSQSPTRVRNLAYDARTAQESLEPEAQLRAGGRHAGI